MSTVEHDPGAHRFSTRVDGHEAVLDYALSGGVMTITHTGVPSAIGGRGVAGELMQRALAVARTAGWTVFPACSYAASYFIKHPEESDLLSPARRQHDAVEHTEKLVDESLEESFPASDPPSVGRSD